MSKNNDSTLGGRQWWQFKEQTKETFKRLEIWDYEYFYQVSWIDGYIVGKGVNLTSLQIDLIKDELCNR